MCPPKEDNGRTISKKNTEGVTNPELWIFFPKRWIKSISSLDNLNINVLIKEIRALGLNIELN